jgi:cytochrome c-type biogenesis protein
MHRPRAWGDPDLKSLSLGLPFLASALFTDRVLRWKRQMGPAARLLQIGAGAVMIAMGGAMLTGCTSVLTFWLLENVPVLARIG